MENQPIIVSETKRPFWQLIIAAILFTISFALLLATFYVIEWTFQDITDSIYVINFAVLISLIATGFCSQKRIYIDTKNSKFRPTIEIGNFKYGKWKTIHNYEYISVFYDDTKSASEQFEVNLWYDSNHHFELYSRNNFEDAMVVGFTISEELNIDLLDATIPHNFKWIDKDELKANTK